MSSVTQTIQTDWVTLSVPDGPLPHTPMEAYWARPTQAGAWPGIIVLMEIFGVNAHIREVTERVAAEGYNALAINYYHRTTPNLELGYTDEAVTLGRKHKEQTTQEGLLADVRAGLTFLENLPDVASKDQFGTLGFCFGGHVAYLAATMPEIKATASFYGAGIATTTLGGGPATVTRTPKLHGKILCFFGEQDPLISPEDVETIEQALKESHIPHEIIRYPQAGHGFFCNQRNDYNPEAAQDAWEKVKQLFHQQLSD